jgi:RHS repeat-associated protein
MGSTTVVAYESESLVESLDYFPYGGVRIDTKTNYGGVRNKYAGTVYDPLSGLNYMQARYQNSSRGQFISEDPSFLAVGNPNQLKQLTSQDQSLFLADPQQLNSYSYGRDNPITKSDPQGNQFCEAACADLAVYPAAAYFGPAILTGVGAAATYISTDILLRANQPRWVGTVPTLDPGNMGFGPSPSGPEDWRPDLDNKSKWMKSIAIGGIATMAGAELLQPIFDLYTSLTNRGASAQQALKTQLNSPSTQARYQATQSYNAATGASTPQQQLWVTPNGAVVNWGGQVVAPAPSSNKISTK